MSEKLKPIIDMVFDEITGDNTIIGIQKVIWRHVAELSHDEWALVMAEVKLKIIASNKFDQ